MIGYSTDKVLSEDLWQIALETMDTIEMDAAFSNSLRGWIAIGVQRMIRQDRVSPPDVTLAHANLVKFIGLLKKEAMYLGHPLRLDSNTLIATKKGLRLRASATAFELWPFLAAQFRGFLECRTSKCDLFGGSSVTQDTNTSRSFLIAN